MTKVSNEEIINAVKNSKTMAEASRSINISFNTFKERAKKLGVYIPNQSGKGTEKEGLKKSRRYPLETLLVENSSYKNTWRLKKYLIEAGLLEDKCESCGLEGEWNNKHISLHLDHVNGINNDHRIENLRVLCPNCHSQTDTYTGKNLKGNKIKNAKKPKFSKECKHCNNVFEYTYTTTVFCSDKCRNRNKKITMPL